MSSSQMVPPSNFPAHDHRLPLGEGFERLQLRVYGACRVSTCTVKSFQQEARRRWIKDRREMLWRTSCKRPVAVAVVLHESLRF